MLYLTPLPLSSHLSSFLFYQPPLLLFSPLISTPFLTSPLFFPLFWHHLPSSLYFSPPPPPPPPSPPLLSSLIASPSHCLTLLPLSPLLSSPLLSSFSSPLFPYSLASSLISHRTCYCIVNPMPRWKRASIIRYSCRIIEWLWRPLWESADASHRLLTSMSRVSRFLSLVLPLGHVGKRSE